MTDNTAAAKPRTPPKHKIVRVEDATGKGAFYWAQTLASAKAMHVDTITARNATPQEQIMIGSRGIVVIGMPDDAGDEQAEQQLDAFAGDAQE